MTLSALPSTYPLQYAGDDSTTGFAITFVYWDDSDIQAILTDSSGNETTWVDGTDYTLSGGDGATGTLTATAAPATGETLTIRSNRAFTQAADFPSGGAFPSADAEQGLDQAVRLVQQVNNLIERSVRAADTTDLSSFSMQLPVTLTASKYIQINSGGTGFTLGSGPTADTSALVVVDTAAPTNTAGLIWIDTGTTNQQIWKQGDGTDWITVLTVNTDTNDITYSLADDSVTTAKIADNAVDGDKLADALIATGVQTVWVPAVAMTARTTNGAASGSSETTTQKIMLETLDFDKDTDEFAQFQIKMPKGWNESTVTFRPVWSHAAATTFVVIWGLQAVALGDSDAVDGTAFGTAQTSTDTGGTTDDIYIGPESSAITIAGTPAEGDWVVFQVYRDADNGSDTLDVDARLHGVELLYTIDTANDT